MALLRDTYHGLACVTLELDPTCVTLIHRLLRVSSVLYHSTTSLWNISICPCILQPLEPTPCNTSQRQEIAQLVSEVLCKNKFSCACSSKCAHHQKQTRQAAKCSLDQFILWPLSSAKFICQIFDFKFPKLAAS